jgi:hypothetical protein
MYIVMFEFGAMLEGSSMSAAIAVEFIGMVE